VAGAALRCAVAIPGGRLGPLLLRVLMLLLLLLGRRRG
jgi:hypothetical protein